jgi:diguanylate cyclase (GGDEF)-like protein/PAS domain S-box-containing protein
MNPYIDPRWEASYISDLIQQQTSQIYLIFDLDHQLRYYNPAIQKVLGIEQINTDTLLQNVHPEDVSILNEKYFLAARNTTFTTSQIRFFDFTGNIKWYRANWCPFYNEHGTMTGTLVTLVDITAQKFLEEQSKSDNEMFNSLFESNILGVAQSDLEGNIYVANDAILQMLGYTRGEFNAGLLKWTDITPPEYTNLDAQKNQEIELTGKCAPFEIEYLRKDNSRVPVLVGVIKMLEQNGQCLSLVVDLTRQKSLENQLVFQASHDILTGLHNRRFFMERIQQLFEEEREISLMFVDVDDFKSINDNYGHQVGDAALSCLGQKLKLHLRQSDFVARLGGDEFVILLENALPDDIHRIASRIYEELAGPQLLDGQLVKIQVSIGIVTATKQHSSAQALLQQADLAMYSAKQNGKGQYYILDEQTNYVLS